MPRKGPFGTVRGELKPRKNDLLEPECWQPRKKQLGSYTGLLQEERAACLKEQKAARAKAAADKTKAAQDQAQATEELAA